MSAKFTAVLIFFLFIILSAPVLAQESTSPAATRREKLQEKVDTLKQNLATREAALKNKLKAFRDKRKAEVTERISTNLSLINQKMTERMLKFLDNASGILTKLQERVNSGSPDIKDPVAAKEAITEAKVAISDAKALVSAQAGKDYTVVVTSESKARTDVKSVRDRLHSDLKAVREAVIKAKQAVANAIRVAKSGKLEIPKEGTPSGR